MFTLIDLMAVAILSFALGMSLILVLFRMGQITAESANTHPEISEDTKALKRSQHRTYGKTLPFIEIPSSTYDDGDFISTKESLENLKRKIEGFKDRNQFYKGEHR